MTTLDILSKGVYPIFNIIIVFWLARYITKQANWDIKKRELKFSILKDFEIRIESLYNRISNCAHEKGLSEPDAKRILIDLKLISNLYSIIIEGVENKSNKEEIKKNKDLFNEFREWLSDIEIRKNGDETLFTKDLINKYSSFIGSYLKLKLMILNKAES
ncbi:hypothetical protein [Leptospira santarosai]|uniref:hypothetical protein n=1 Tax=Leptospira santarosai TaxID=28183 RepID=UPI001E3A7FDB|nr:hypothetical protein [Leptospira santarosai]MDI7158414.1 hypothetical protein [Leptospira santarosai]